MTTKCCRSIPFMCIFYIYIHLLSKRGTQTYIIHSLSPLKSRTNNSPIIFVTINHVLYLLQIRSKVNWESDKKPDNGSRSRKCRRDINPLFLCNCYYVLSCCPPRTLNCLTLTFETTIYYRYNVFINLLICFNLVT